MTHSLLMDGRKYSPLVADECSQGSLSPLQPQEAASLLSATFAGFNPGPGLGKINAVHPSIHSSNSYADTSPVTIPASRRSYRTEQQRKTASSKEWSLKSSIDFRERERERDVVTAAWLKPGNWNCIWVSCVGARVPKTWITCFSGALAESWIRNGSATTEINT